MLRIQNVPNFSIPDPVSRVKKIPDPGSASKNLSIFNPKTAFKLLEKWPGMFSLDTGSVFFPILHSGSRGQKGTGSGVPTASLIRSLVLRKSVSTPIIISASVSNFMKKILYTTVKLWQFRIQFKNFKKVTFSVQCSYGIYTSLVKGEIWFKTFMKSYEDRFCIFLSHIKTKNQRSKTKIGKIGLCTKK